MGYANCALCGSVGFSLSEPRPPSGGRRIYENEEIAVNELEPSTALKTVRNVCGRVPLVKGTEGAERIDE